jgi:hypothetical protein
MLALKTCFTDGMNMMVSSVIYIEIEDFYKDIAIKNETKIILYTFNNLLVSNIALQKLSGQCIKQ